MHLAIVSPYPPSITDVGQYGYHISRMLARSGIFHRVTVLADASNGHKQPQTATTLRVNYPWRIDHLNAGWTIASHLRQINPDIVWFNLGVSAFGKSPLANLSGFLSPALGRFMGLPTVVTLEQRRDEYHRLLLQAPAVTELSHLDSTGREELRISRLAMDVIGSGIDFSTEPKFREAKTHKIWFSQVYFRRDRSRI